MGGPGLGSAEQHGTGDTERGPAHPLFGELPAVHYPLDQGRSQRRRPE